VVRDFWAGKGRPAGPPSATAAKHGAAIITFEYFEGAFRNFVTDGAALHRSHTDLRPVRRLLPQTESVCDLPFGTRVRATGMASSRSVVVRIADRGPWIRDRELDLSLGCCAQFGYH
jgi:hypothetical protein